MEPFVLLLEQRTAQGKREGRLEGRKEAPRKRLQLLKAPTGQRLQGRGRASAMPEGGGGDATAYDRGVKKLFGAYTEPDESGERRLHYEDLQVAVFPPALSSPPLPLCSGELSPARGDSRRVCLVGLLLTNEDDGGYPRVLALSQ